MKPMAFILRRLNFTLGIFLIGIIVLGAALGLSPMTPDPLMINISERLAPPSASHILGADEFGRDVFSRVATGALVSGGIAFTTVSIVTILGTILGLVAGYLRGWTDRIMMAIIDALLAFPGILLALALVAVFGASRWGIIIALSVAYLPIVVRVVRGNTLSIREREFIEAARLGTSGPGYIVIRHVLPNALAPIAVLATSMLGWVLLSESALSFLGVGVSPPTPTWGNMLSSSRPYLEVAPHLAIVPGLCIMMTMLGLNFLGDWLRDRLDPREDRA